MRSGTGTGASAGPGAGAEAGGPGTLRYGSAERAGLLPRHLDSLVSDAEAFLGPSPAHPWYAGAVLLAGRGHTVALHRPIGLALRYERYDETTDTGIELPPERQVPMTRDTVFDLASLTKLFTAVLAVRQIEEGRLDPDGHVAAYLPLFGAAGKRDITVRQLLTHTSGLRAWLPLYGEPGREGRLRLLWDDRPAHPPGTRYVYSDLNLITVQLVLEAITGRPLDALLAEQVTGPLGMTGTRFVPPSSWRPFVAATEDARPPWSGLHRGLVRGEVHDENAHALGGVAGHAGIFSRAWDLAVLARTLLDGGAYGGVRVLSEASVELLLADALPAFPGEPHGLGFELCRPWYMGALAGPRTAGHTGFTGTSLVLDPVTDTFLVVLGTSVHPVRSWRSGSAPRVAAADRLARAVPVRAPSGRPAWFSGMARGTTATLTLPPVPGAARLECALWWHTAPGPDPLFLEASADGGAGWAPVPFTVDGREARPAGSVGGASDRSWHTVAAPLPACGPVRLRWRYVTGPYPGRGVYADGLRLLDAAGRPVFDETRPADAARVTADGWERSPD